MKYLNLSLILVVLLFSSMADASRGSIRKSKIVNDAETNFVEINSDKDMQVTDSPNSGGVDKVFNLTTTAQEVRVGASPKTNRKYIYLEALDRNIKWGFNTDCNFSLKRGSFFILPVGQNTTVYAKTSSGTADMVGAEL